MSGFKLNWKDGTITDKDTNDFLTDNYGQSDPLMPKGASKLTDQVWAMKLGTPFHNL